MDPRLLISTLRADKKLVPCFVIALVIAQSVTVIASMYVPDKEPDYKYFVIPYVQQCNPMKYPERPNYALDANGTVPIYTTDLGTSPTRDPLKWWINCVSYKEFHSPKVIPLLFNIGIMPLTYLLALQLTKDKIIGMLSMIALTWNPIYTDWITNGTYDQVWSFFLLLSFYLMIRFKDSTGSSISFLVAIAAKTLSVIFLPLWGYMLLSSNTTKRNKVTSLVILAAAFSLAVIILKGNIDWTIGSNIGLHLDHIDDAVYRNLGILWQVIPALLGVVGIGATFSTKRKIPGRAYMAIGMLTMVVASPIVSLLTDQGMFTYRYVPFAVFMSIFIGMTIVEVGNFVVEARLKKAVAKK